MSSRHKHGKKNAATNGRPVQRHYLGVHKRPGGRYDAFITNPAKNTTLWLGTFDTAEKAALVYDSAARQLQGNKAKTNSPNPNHLLCPKAVVPPPALEVRLSSYSGGDAAAEPMFTYPPAAPLPPEELELSRFSYSSGGHAAAGPMFMHHPVAPLPSEALGLNLSSYYGGHVAAGPMFMYHPGVINNDIDNNLNMSYETSVGGSSNSGYSECGKSKNLELDLNFPPQ